MRTATRWIAGAGVAAALMLGAGGTAFAGEIKGPPGSDGFATGGPTPITTYIAKSICAFSGLNAYHPGKEGEYPGNTQSYGQIVRQGLKAVVPSPGDACNGHTGELAQP